MVIEFDNLTIKAKRIDQFRGTQCATRSVRDYRIFALLKCETLEIRNMHGESIECACRLFGLCMALRHLIFNNVSLPNVDTAAELFDGCRKLTKIDVVGVTPLLPRNRHLFKLFSDTKIESININDFIRPNGEQIIESFEMMLSNMKNLKEANLDSLYIRPKLEITKSKFKYSDRSMFDNSASRIKINLPNDKITRQFVLKCLLHAGWHVNDIAEYCTLGGKPVDRDAILFESAENIVLD